MPPESSAASGEFSIATPADWIVVDVEALGDRAVIAGLVDQRVAEEPALDRYRDELAELVERSARLADQAGVLFCATLATTRGDDAPILATVTVAAGERPSTDVAAPSQDETDRAPGVLVNQIDEPDGSTRFAPAGVELPAGPAMRIQRVEDVPLFSDTSLVCLSVQYVLGVPYAPDQFIALTFTTPSLAYRARLSNLFGDIAATFAWVDGPRQGAQ